MRLLKHRTVLETTYATGLRISEALHLRVPAVFHAEAATLRFVAGGYDDVPEEKRPIVPGRIRFAKQSGMTLETNSIERAFAGLSRQNSLTRLPP